MPGTFLWNSIYIYICSRQQWFSCILPILMSKLINQFLHTWWSWRVFHKYNDRNILVLQFDSFLQNHIPHINYFIKMESASKLSIIFKRLIHFSLHLHFQRWLFFCNVFVALLWFLSLSAFLFLFFWRAHNEKHSF